MTENRSLLDILTELRDRGLEAVANASADNGRLSPQLLLEVEALAKRVDARQPIEQAQRRAARHAEPVSHRKVLNEFMRVFDATPVESRLTAPLDERTASAFNLTADSFSQYAAGLSDALNIGFPAAATVIDGLALVVTGGAS